MAAETQVKSQAPRSSRKGIAFSVLVIVLIAVGAAVWSGQTREPAALSGGNGPVKSTLHLETFVLNLGDPAQRSYLRVGIDLGLDREPGKAENAPPVAQARDTILGVLGQSGVDELLTPAGKNKLKEDLLRALQQRLPELGVQEVYFTEFLIQR